MNTETKRNQLLEFVKELKSKGFKVYGPTDLTTYCNFVKDGQIGYVERGDNGFNFSTVHKPCQECGTGYFTHREVAYPTILMAEDCLGLAPHWASSRDIQAIKKYKNWSEYIKYPINRIIPLLEL